MPLRTLIYVSDVRTVVVDGIHNIYLGIATVCLCAECAERNVFA